MDNALPTEQAQDNKLDILNSFVPDILVAKLKESLPSNRPLEPYSKLFVGVCLIVDISGFTRISGQFCSQGKKGIDGLQQLLNGYMGNLVSCIYKHNGDVMKFAGDALICVFVPSTENSKDMLLACQQAFLCAWELKDICTEQLTAHIAIGKGELCVAIVGGHEGRYEFLQSGDCMELISHCLDNSPARSVTVASDFFQYVQRLIRTERSSFVLEGSQLQSNRVRISGACNNDTSCLLPENQLRNSKLAELGKGTSPIAAQIERFVPLPVSQALQSGLFHFLAELREVTTVFMKWEGFSADVNRDLLSLQVPFLAAQEVIATSGGFLRQFLVDDKGCVLIAMWGVPTATFPDNCLRALWTATVLCNKLGSLGMPLSCGITTGNVYCGVVGSPIRQEYAAIGAVVNLSARLMSKADCGILLDEESFYRLPEIMHPKMTKKPMKFKGYDDELNVYNFNAIDEPFDFKNAIFSLDEDRVPIRAECKVCFIPLLTFLVGFSHLTMDYSSEFGSKKTKESPWWRWGLCSPADSDAVIETSTPARIRAKPGASRSFHHFSNMDRDPDAAETSVSMRVKDLVRKNGASDEKQSTPGMRVVLVEGAPGMGKGKSLSWMRQCVSRMHIKDVHVTLSKGDTQQDYGGISKLFHHLVGEQWDNPSGQAQFIQFLLRELYPTDKEMRYKIAYPTLVTCLHAAPPTNSHCKRQYVHVDLQVLKANNKQKSQSSTDLLGSRPITLLAVHKCLCEIFKLLLCRQPMFLSIENVHYLDALSWRLLLEFPKFETNTVMVLTSVCSDASASTSQSSGSPAPVARSFSLKGNKKMASSEMDVFKTGMSSWVENNISSLINNNPHNVQRISLSILSFDEIVSSLAYCLKTRPNMLPLGLATTVFQLSGANPLWVSEICEFIKSNGVEEFMNSMSSGDEEVEKSRMSSKQASMKRFDGTGGPSRQASIMRLENAGTMSPIKTQTSFRLDSGGEPTTVAAILSSGKSMLKRNSTTETVEEISESSSMRLSRQSSFKKSLLESSPAGRIQRTFTDGSDLEAMIGEPQPLVPSRKRSVDRLPAIALASLSRQGADFSPLSTQQEGGSRRNSREFQTQIQVDGWMNTAASMASVVTSNLPGTSLLPMIFNRDSFRMNSFKMERDSSHSSLVIDSAKGLNEDEKQSPGISRVIQIPSRDSSSSKHSSQLNEIITARDTGTGAHTTARDSMTTAGAEKSPLASAATTSVVTWAGSPVNISRTSFNTAATPLDEPTSNMRNLLTPIKKSFSGMGLAALGSPSPRKMSTKELKPSANNKLAFLVVCRFAKLSSESQSVARTASIVGTYFTADILSTVVPAVISSQLLSILEGLVSANWLDPPLTIENKDGSSYEQFSFIHPMVHRTIYDLTPPSIRGGIHLQVAEYLEKEEKALSNRNDYLQIVAFHYLKCSNAEVKSFEALSKVAIECVSQPLGDLDSCLVFIEYAAEYARTELDYAALIGIILKARDRFDQDTLSKKKKEKKSSFHLVGKAIAPLETADTSFLDRIQATELELIIAERKARMSGKGSLSVADQQAMHDALPQWQQQLCDIRKRGLGSLEEYSRKGFGGASAAGLDDSSGMIEDVHSKYCTIM